MLSKILANVFVKLSIAASKLTFARTRFQISSVRKLNKRLMLNVKWNPAAKKSQTCLLKRNKETEKFKISKNSKLSESKMREDWLNSKLLKNDNVKS